MNENQVQSQKNDDKELLKNCKKKLKKMYKLFFNDPGFEKFVVQDIMNRSIKLIEAIRADSELDLDELTVSNMTEKVKTKDLSDPFALSFLM